MNVFNFNAEIITQRGKSPAEACARRIKFPRAFVAINFTEDNRRLDRKIFQRERGNFSAYTKNFQGRAANHAEILPALISVVNCGGQRNFLDVAGNFFKVNID